MDVPVMCDTKGFSLNFIFEDFFEIRVLLKSDRNDGYFTCKPINIFIMSYSFLLRIRNVSDESCRQNSKHILCSVLFFANCAVYEKMWNKYCKGGQATDDDMAHTHCMLDT